MKPKTGSYDVGVIVGRFQVAELHEAHVELIESVRNLHPRVVIILGMGAVVGTRNNPLNFEARRQMIQEKYPDIDVVYIKDTKSDETWSRRLDEIVQDLLGPQQTAVLYGSRDSFIKYYTGKFPTLELVATKVVSGTELREAISKKAKPSYDWRAGAIWQTYNQYRKVYPTVDIAIHRNGKYLFVKKPGENLWRFPGGFAEPVSPTFEADALREAAQETHLECTDPEYIGSFKIDDWRYRGEADCIKTLLFHVQSPSGQEKADDDVDRSGWFFLNQLKPDDVEPEHRVLFAALMKFLGLTPEGEEPEHKRREPEEA